MNDAEALKEINRVLDSWFKGQASEIMVLAQIARITGLTSGAQK